LISMRENRLRLQWYHKVFEEAQKVTRLILDFTINCNLIQC